MSASDSLDKSDKRYARRIRYCHPSGHPTRPYTTTCAACGRRERFDAINAATAYFLYESVCFLDQRIDEREEVLKGIARKNDACQILMKISVIGIPPRRSFSTWREWRQTSRTVESFRHISGLRHARTP